MEMWTTRRRRNRGLHPHEDFSGTGCFDGEFCDDCLDAWRVRVLDCSVHGSFLHGRHVRYVDFPWELKLELDIRIDG